MQSKKIKVLYLFNQPRKSDISAIENGRRHEGHLYGMRLMKKFGIEARYIELENFLPNWASTFLRKSILNIYFVHLPLLPLFFNYDIIFTPTAFGSQFVKTILGFKKTKWIMYDFNIVGWIGNGETLKQKVFTWMVSKAGGIVTIGKEEEQVLNKMFPEMKEKIQFIPYAVDDSFFVPQDVPEDIIILTVGIDSGRDYKTFFEACCDLDVKVVLAGDQYKLKKLDIPKNVEIRRFSSEEMLTVYSKAKIVVIPLDISKGNNNAMGGSTVVESMIMGKATIVSKTPTMESYIKDGETGVLVPQGDSHALKKAMVDLLQNDEKRKKLGINARNFAIENLSKNIVAKKLADFFNKIV